MKVKELDKKEQVLKEIQKRVEEYKANYTDVIIDDYIEYGEVWAIPVVEN